MTSSDERLYVILLSEVPGTVASEALIRRHVAFLRDLDREGKLVLCGPFADFRGGMVVIRASDKESAASHARRDPFVLEGVRTFELRTWVLSNEANHHLGMG